MLFKVPEFIFFFFFQLKQMFHFDLTYLFIIADIDECSDDEHLRCHGNNATCINTLGSYQCECDDGYDLSDNTCVGKYTLQNECLIIF